jgi:glycosyltransferase involved in cell wall biosynthesis
MKLSSDSNKTAEADIDIIVPCYNYGRFLRGCVESILRATSLQVRVIIVDDCSTDDTQQVCVELQAEYKSILVIRHDKNLGHISTYNHGLSLVNAKYLHLISADDQLTPFALDRAVAIFSRHPDVGMVYGRTEVGVLPRNSESYTRPRATYSVFRGVDWVEARCRDGGNPIYSPEVTLRTETAVAAGAYEPLLPVTADLEMWLRIAARSNVAVVEGANQAFYRIHPHNMHKAHSREGLIYGFLERARTYEVFFQEHGHLLPNPAMLHDLARAKVAQDALLKTEHAYSGYQANYDDLIEVMAFAESISPAARQFPEWTTVQRRLACGREVSSALIVRMYVQVSVRLRNWWHWQLRTRYLGRRGLRVLTSGQLP